MLAELLQSRFEYCMTAILILVGMYGVVVKRNLVKKFIGLNILQTGIVLLFVSLGLKEGGTVPIDTVNTMTDRAIKAIREIIIPLQREASAE